MDRQPWSGPGPGVRPSSVTCSARYTDHQVERVFLPTYGSWLNWIEAEFAALRYFALNGTDHQSHSEQNAETYAPPPPRAMGPAPPHRRESAPLCGSPQAAGICT
ncbi:hypothetical protein BU204_35665 [Actinophytocola xanthii]|uniref:Tc1-like transposase DDE domain-containing protein n=1 Tax=Actinophytocola xanthii TaxID=1912961 RepID=A0A1Q8BZD2_9PSEU|nr:hypothetical protein BU204_35665 [Actinophytocola xanthii]